MMTGPLIGAGSTLKLTRTLAQQLDPPMNPTAIPSLGTGRYADLRGINGPRRYFRTCTRRLDAMSTDGLRRWSANNRLIALLQLHERAKGRPELLGDVHMMSFRQWDKEHGRRVTRSMVGE